MSGEGKHREGREFKQRLQDGMIKKDEESTGLQKGSR